MVVALLLLLFVGIAACLVWGLLLCGVGLVVVCFLDFDVASGARLYVLRCCLNWLWVMLVGVVLFVAGF